MPITVKQPILLLVEGRADKEFFEELAKNLKLTDLQIEPFGGTEFHAELKLVAKDSYFKSNGKLLGIVRDADDNPKAAFDSVCTGLRNAGLPIPQQPMQTTNTEPRVAIMIIHPEKSPGMLETLCFEAIGNQSTIECVEDYFRCLQAQGIELASTAIPKAKLQVLLASKMRSKDKTGLWLGVAVKRDWWPWDNPVFDDAKRFLHLITRSIEG